VKNINNTIKNISLKKQQKYITQIDDFRLTQDRVYKDLNIIILDYIKNNKNKLMQMLIGKIIKLIMVLFLVQIWP